MVKSYLHLSQCFEKFYLLELEGLGKEEISLVMMASVHALGFELPFQGPAGLAAGGLS